VTSVGDRGKEKLSGCSRWGQRVASQLVMVSVNARLWSGKRQVPFLSTWLPSGALWNFVLSICANGARSLKPCKRHNTLGYILPSFFRRSCSRICLFGMLTRTFKMVARRLGSWNKRYQFRTFFLSSPLFVLTERVTPSSLTPRPHPPPLPFVHTATRRQGPFRVISHIPPWFNGSSFPFAFTPVCFGG